jgi:hypothetical protein
MSKQWSVMVPAPPLNYSDTLSRMNIHELVSSISLEISRLEQARALLVGSAPRPGAPRKRRHLSAEARARISEAQRKRWAKQKKAA